MRDWMMLAGLLCMLPFAVTDMTAAYLLWGWTTVLSPNYYLYGFMESVRFNLVFALIALTLLLFKGKQAPAFRWNSTSILMTLFLAQTMLSALFGYADNPFNETLSIQFLKSMVFCLVMAKFINTRTHLHALLAMIGLGLGFHGVVEGLKVVASGGAHHVAGLATSMMADNNHFGVAMVMAIPVLYYLLQQSSHAWSRTGFFTALSLTVITIFGTQSRGAAIALAVVALWLILTSRFKFRALVILLVGSVVIFAMAPDAWFERLDTIKTADQDSSFMGRVVAWKVSSAIALKNPIFGGGFHSLQVQYVWEEFKYNQGLLGFVTTPEPDLRAKAAHSIYFEILGDMGFLGLALFVALLANCFRIRYSILRMAKAAGDSQVWAIDLANALMLALMAYCVGGSAVSLGYFEVPYMIMMAMERLNQHMLHIPAAAPAAIRE